MKFTSEKLAEFVHLMEEMYDKVRIVDATNTAQYSVSKEGKLIRQPGQCYSLWNKDYRCENCISAKAYTEKNRQTKFEFIGKEIYFVISTYIEIDNKPFLLEAFLALRSEAMINFPERNEFIRKMEQYTRESFFDALTGARNRGYYEDQLRILTDIRSVAMLDIDHFKNINDTYGHIAGDEVLKTVIQKCRESLRKEDNIVRFGGDEFLLIQKDTSEKAFKERLEYIRKEVESLHFPEYPDMTVTVSIGAVVLHECNTPMTVEELVKQSDQLLYLSKKTRNTLTIKTL